MIIFLLLSLHNRSNEGMWQMWSWRAFMTSSQKTLMMRKIPSLWKSSKNRRHNGTRKRRCFFFTLMASKRQSSWQPRNVTPYWSRYPSEFEVQTRDNYRMALAPSTSNNFNSVTSKLCHAFIYIPQANGLFSPVNQIIALDPELVFLHQNPKLLIAFKDMKTLLHESTLRPIKYKELISGWPDYIGVKYLSGHGVGGVVFGENLPCTPTVFRMKWL